MSKAPKSQSGPSKSMENPFEQLLLDPIEKKVPVVVKIGLTDHSGRYRIGAPFRPFHKHDNGHLDKFSKRDPTIADRLAYTKWVFMLDGATAACKPGMGDNIWFCHGDLTDATAAYRHFLFGNGADRTFDYERFLKNDPAAATLLTEILDDFIPNIEIIGKDRVKFSVTGNMYAVGFNGLTNSPPATANWQKTIGAHTLWVSADVCISANSDGLIVYDTDLTLHVEDKFNFNPGAKDAATGIADSDNGRLELSGLGTQYMNFSTVTRHVKWIEKNKKSRVITGNRNVISSNGQSKKI